MKRKVLLITLASLASIMSITGCKKSQKYPNKIYVSVVSLGYKYQWLNDLMSAYSNKTGTKFSLQVQYGQDGNNKLNNENHQQSSNDNQPQEIITNPENNLNNEENISIKPEFEIEENDKTQDSIDNTKVNIKKILSLPKKNLNL
jgi:hypothetical protein